MNKLIRSGLALALVSLAACKGNDQQSELQKSIEGAKEQAAIAAKKSEEAMKQANEEIGKAMGDMQAQMKDVSKQTGDAMKDMGNVMKQAGEEDSEEDDMEGMQ